MLLKSTMMLLTAIALVAAQERAAEREMLAMIYPEGRAISVELSGTARLPASKLKGSGVKLDRKSARRKLN